MTFAGITYNKSPGIVKRPIFGGTPMIGSILKRNNKNFKHSSAAQPPMAEFVSLSTQYTNSRFRNTVQNQNTTVPTATHVGFGQYRHHTQIKPQRNYGGTPCCSCCRRDNNFFNH